MHSYSSYKSCPLSDDVVVVVVDVFDEVVDDAAAGVNATSIVERGLFLPALHELLDVLAPSITPPSTPSSSSSFLSMFFN